MLKNNNNIFLTGCMGAGKTTVGKMIALRLKRDFVDTDVIIEKKTEMNILDIFERLGENKFRMIETEVISDLIKRTGQIIALGGGAIISQRNREQIGKSGLKIYLKATAKTLCLRVNAEERPLLKGLGRSETLKKIRQILDERKIFYEDADIIVQVDDVAPQDVVDSIIERLELL